MSKLSPLFRAFSLALICGAALLSLTTPAQACTLVLITQPTVLTSPIECIGVDGASIPGDIVNATTINNTTPSVATSPYAFFVRNSTITGRFINNGTIDISGAASQTSFALLNSNVQGGIVNNGTIHAAINPAFAIIGSVQTGAIDNFGVMRSDGAAVLGFGASAGFYLAPGSSLLNTLTNHSGALIQGAEVGIFARESTNWTGGIANAGTINGGVIGIDLVGNFAGGITNHTTGLISANNGSGILVLGPVFSGGIDNAGRIAAFGNIIPTSPFVSGGLGVRMLANSGSGTFYNRATGVIDGTYVGMEFNGTTFNGLLRNAGSILGGDPLETTGFGYGFGVGLSYINWTGDVVNEATGIIAARTQNLIVPGFTADNAGLAIARRNQNGELIMTFNGNISNAGTITGPIGVEVMVDSFTGNFINSGLISSVTNATQSNFGNARGVRFIANTFLGDFTNSSSGVIRDASSTAPGGEVHTVGIDVIDWIGTFRNAGRIEHSDTPDCGDCSVGVQIDATNWTGDFINEASGVIGDADFGVSVVVQNFIGNVHNDGTIGGPATNLGMVFTAANFHGNIANRAGGVIEGLNLGLGICSFCEEDSLTPADGFVGTLTNAGRIANTNPDPEQPWAALIIFQDTWSGNIVNDNGGIITSPSTAVIMAKHSPLIEEIEDTAPMGLFLGNFVNRGTIEGTIDIFVEQWTGDFFNSGAIHNDSEGTAIKFTGAITGGLFNSGSIDAGVALDLTGITSALTYRQTDASAQTSGDILLSSTSAMTLDFRGGRMTGDILGGSDLNDRFEVNAGAAGSFAYIEGILSNFAAFAVNSGTATLGASAPGVNGNGVTMTNAGALSVASGATLYLDDHASIAATSATFAPGSTFAAFFTTNTAQHASISVSGTATLGGDFVAWLDPMSFSGSSQTSFLYNGVIAGPVSGTFNSVTIQGAPSLFRITGIYNSFDLLIERTSFAELADPESPNQENIGDALEEIYQGGTDDSDLLNLIDVIANSPGPLVNDIYDAIAGSTQAETETAALKTDDPWKQSVGQRVNAARSTGCTVAGDTWCFKRYAQAPAPVATDATADSDAFAWLETGIRDAGATSIWGRVVGVWGQTDGGVSSPGSSQRTYGLIAGADHVVNATLLVGLAGQYVRTNADFEASRNGSSIEALQVGAYFSYGGAEGYVNGNASVIGTRSETDRFFSVGAIDYHAAARFPSTSLTGSLEAGQIFEAGNYRLEPNFGVNYAAQFTDSYREHGAGGLGLIVDPEDLQSLRSMVGGRVSRVYDIGDRKFVPEIRAEWRHEFLDRRHTFQAAFQGAPEANFLVSCETSARDTFALGTSITVPLSGRVTGFVDAEGAFSEDARSGTLSLGARATW